MRKPRAIFDRDREWASLAAFVADPRQRFGIVYGRRRQGKSWLLERICAGARGWYWEAIEGTSRQQLEAFATAFQAFSGSPARPGFGGWADALDAVWRAKPPVLVLDELQYLVAASPELPSMLQSRVSRPGGPRLIVCGSALGPMRDLLASDAPLRGRASLELVVGPFDPRTAARYWRMGAAWSRSVELHALVGGTPAYLDFAGGRSPRDFPTLDDWVCEVLLDPAGALFREGRILADEPALLDRGLYRGILAAVAGGSTRRGQIAAVLGRPDNTLAHPLNALVELGLLERLADPLRERRSSFRLAEPLLRTYQMLIAPHEGEIERRGARRVWSRLRSTVSSRIFGPHFETLAREWIARYSSDATLGGAPDAIGSTTASDTDARKEVEIDVVATAGDRVLAVGEAKWSARPLGIDALRALERKRDLLGPRAARAKLLLFGRTGFDRHLAAVARRRRDVELVDPKRMYRGE